MSWGVGHPSIRLLQKSPSSSFWFWAHSSLWVKTTSSHNLDFAVEAEFSHSVTDHWGHWGHQRLGPQEGPVFSNVAGVKEFYHLHERLCFNNHADYKPLWSFFSESKSRLRMVSLSVLVLIHSTNVRHYSRWWNTAMCKAFKFTALQWRKQKINTHANKCPKYF